MRRVFWDTDINKMDWYRRRPIWARLAYRYIWDHCDINGQFEPDYKELSEAVGVEVEPAQLLFMFGDKILRINSTTVFLPDYLKANPRLQLVRENSDA